MEHQYCLFYKNDRLQFGWIREVRKSKLVVVPVQGKEFVSSANRLEYIWRGKTLTNEKEALVHVSEKAEETIKNAEHIDLAVIHELCDPGTSYQLQELAENFLDHPEDGWSRVSLLIKIKQDKILFQLKKDQIHARSPEEIRKLIEDAERKREHEYKTALEMEWAASLSEHRLPEISPSESDHWNQFLVRIAGFLRYLDASQERDYFHKLFHCQGKEPVEIERKLLDILSLAGVGMSWGRLVVSRMDALNPVDEAERSAINCLMERNIQAGWHGLEPVDERQLLTYTVDNADTRDYDDAISLEQMADCAFLRVHIADVASFVRKGDPLFQKSENRMSSLYTVKEVYPMFHPDLSENVFSLRAGQDRSVMTFEARVDQDGELKETRIYRSLVNVNKNLTYEAVDREIEGQDLFWKRVWKICLKLKQKRIDNGSLELERIEVKLDISDPDHIRIKEVRENTPANQLIEELAIFANHQAALFCKQNDLPSLYRNQPPYSLTRELPEGVKPTLRDIHIQPARVGTIPEGHSALGLDCYLQVTSPIRRFMDLVNQTVVYAGLADTECGYSEEDLLRWARMGEEAQRDYAALERRLLDHWKIKYLYQNQSEVYDARLIRVLRNGRALIKLEKLQLVVECGLDNVPTETFQVIIDQVVPRYDRVIARIHPDSLVLDNIGETAAVE